MSNVVYVVSCQNVHFELDKIWFRSMLSVELGALIRIMFRVAAHYYVAHTRTTTTVKRRVVLIQNETEFGHSSGGASRGA